MKNLYVLLVGINDYPAPLPKLNGCIKDINQIEGYLHDYCAKDFNLKIKILENETATYANIISGFREHLGSAGPDDVAWFHYSGHGSEEKTAPEFLALEPNGKDQTLICIDSRIGGANNLADKELAVLLNELATKNPAGPPHIVVSLDCCHSGSGTRDAGSNIEWGVRNAPSTGGTRTLDSYVDGYYSKQKTLEVPSARHVLLSACKSVQLAGDLPQGGAFTSGLIKALQASKGNLSYTDLFIRARSTVEQTRDNQTPQFETIQNFDPYVRFLEGSPTGERDVYEVIVKDGDWYVKCGAIHGLPTSPSSPIELDIYTSPPEKKHVSTAVIKSVGAQLSKIDIEGSLGVSTFLKSLVSDKPTYCATVRHLPAPAEVVKLSGDAQIIQSIISNESLKSKNILWAQKDEKASIEVIADQSGITVMDLDLNRKAFVTDGSTPEHLITVMDALDKIVHWRRIIELQNKNRSSKVADMCRFELHEINEAGEIKKHTEEQVRIFATSENLENRFPAFRPVVHLENIQQPLYFYLLFIAFDYSISCPGEEIVYRAFEYEDKSHVELPLWKKTLGWGPAKNDVEDTCYFKLLVTTEPLDHQQFLQSGLGIHRDILGEPTPQKVFDDWTSKMIAVTMVRQDNTLNASNDISLADGNISIKAHPSLRGSVSIGQAELNSRSGGQIHAFARLQNEQMQMVDFSPSRSTLSQNVIEINNIELADPSSLENQPLEISFKQTMNDNEVIFPVAFDGKFFHVIGDAVSDAEGTHIRVREIPTMVTSDPGVSGERGIFQTLKMTLCKLILGQQDVNELRYVDKKADGTLELTRESLGIKVTKAKKVLLVLHGFGGDGLGMVNSLKDNLPAEKIDAYDLILVYDYESLNTPLLETATALKKTLEDLGFGKDDRKMTIVSHSIGGLIARWIIEQEGGNKYIEHCILVGTPNNGSSYGKIDGYLKWAKSFLDLAINFIPKIVPFSGILLRFLKGATDLSGSLAQIDPSSDFINRLNSSQDPGVRYTVISADAAGLNIEGSGFDGFIQNAQLRLGKAMNSNEPNDLFAPVKSLQCKELWEGRKIQNIIPEPVSNHHFGYFITQHGTRDTHTVWKIMSEEL